MRELMGDFVEDDIDSNGHRRHDQTDRNGEGQESAREFVGFVGHAFMIHTDSTLTGGGEEKPLAVGRLLTRIQAKKPSNRFLPRVGCPLYNPVMRLQQKKIVKAHCNSCLGEKNHKLLYTEEMKGSDPIIGDFDQELGSMDWSETYEMIKCLGCDSVSLRQTLWCSEDNPGESRVQYFPPTIQRQIPKWIERLAPEDPFSDKKLNKNEAKAKYRRDLLEQIYIALNNDSPLVALMGIRALLESVMIDKVGDTVGFGAKLHAFEQGKFVTPLQRKQLADVLDIGHATIHRHYTPNPQAIELALGLTENILQSIYVHPLTAKGLKVPKRPSQKKLAKVSTTQATTTKP